MAFKTINGKVVKTPNRERNYYQPRTIVPEAGIGKLKHLVIAEIQTGEKKGQQIVEKYKAALKAEHNIIRFAVKEELTFLYR